MASLQLLAGCALDSVQMGGVRAEFCLYKPGVVTIIMFVICGTSLRVLLPPAAPSGLQCPCPIVPSRMFPEQWDLEEVQQLCPVDSFCLLKHQPRLFSPSNLNNFRVYLSIRCASVLMFIFTKG